MTRAEALARLRKRPENVEPDQPYEVGDFVPADGEGVAALFFKVYGDTYPIDTYYMPDAIRQACAQGRLHPVVARLGGGEVVGFAALYKSSPPFAGLLEFGLGIVHPAYRGSFILFHLSNAIMAKLNVLPGLEAVFGEAVCDTIITQHSSSLFGFREVALELDLIPAKDGGGGRTSCLVMFQNVRDRRRILFHPPCYSEQLVWLAAQARLDRELRPVGPGCAWAERTRIDTELFPAASVMRGHVFSLGEDYQAALSEAEAKGSNAGCRIFQIFLNLSGPSPSAAVPFLRDMGYGFCGLAPRWFDDDALLMQKNLDLPDVEGIHLFSDGARSILSMALADRT